MHHFFHGEFFLKAGNCVKLYHKDLGIDYVSDGYAYKCIRRQSLSRACDLNNGTRDSAISGC